MVSLSDRATSLTPPSVVTKSSADYHVERTQLRRTKKAAATRGLTRSHNRTLKHVFNGAAALHKKSFLHKKSGVCTKSPRRTLRREIRLSLIMLTLIRP
jgi:hypothetical protein